VARRIRGQHSGNGISFRFPQEVFTMKANVIQELRQMGAHFEVLHHAPSYTSVQGALAVGVAAAEVLKTVVLDTAVGHALAVLPANRDLDMHLVRDAVADSHVHLATEAEIERDLPDYDLGAVPPFGSFAGMPVFVDPEVLSHPTVVFSAGNSTVSIRGQLEEMFAGEPVTIVRLAQRDARTVLPA
jgi:Uncharacterized conserved protein